MASRRGRSQSVKKVYCFFLYIFIYISLYLSNRMVTTSGNPMFFSCLFNDRPNHHKPYWSHRDSNQRIFILFSYRYSRIVDICINEVGSKHYGIGFKWKKKTFIFRLKIFFIESTQTKAVTYIRFPFEPNLTCKLSWNYRLPKYPK